MAPLQRHDGRAVPIWHPYSPTMAPHRTEEGVPLELEQVGKRHPLAGDHLVVRARAELLRDDVALRDFGPLQLRPDGACAVVARLLGVRERRRENGHLRPAHARAHVPAWERRRVGERALATGAAWV
eukprot:2664347-Prymnesium_polylepis.1